MKYFQSSDGWLFCTLRCLHKKRLSLGSLISIGDTLNHAIFELEEINGGLSRLENEGFFSLKNNRVYITTKGKKFHKQHKKLFDLCISEQIRYQEIFSKMPMESDEKTKVFFQKDEYDAIVCKY